MGLFDFLRRGLGKAADTTAVQQERRVDRLLRINHNHLEAPEKAFDGDNFLQLVERQLERGQTDIALFNICCQVKYCFELANLYWGQGELPKAEHWLRSTIERHTRLGDACAALGMPRRSYREIEYAKCAAVLLGVEVADLSRADQFEHCYEPWFKDALLSACLGTRPFDMAVWQRSQDAWARKRFPKYRMEEFAVYVRALTGDFDSTDAMLASHAEMFAGRSKRNPDTDLLEGYHDNDLIIDHVFAAILKRIGWQGRYRHSWPHSDTPGSGWSTNREPDRYLETIAAPTILSDPKTGLIGDPQAARRFIDVHVPDQRDERGEAVDALRPAKDRAKVAAALKAIGWTRDPATVDLMRHYQMDLILNDSTHIFLCDPLARGSPDLARWTKLLHDDFGLHAEFIAIAASEERADWSDPQGAWFVLWTKDRRVYAIDRDDWHNPNEATRAARVGVDLWPSYTSFVAWWVAQHIEAHS